MGEGVPVPVPEAVGRGVAVKAGEVVVDRDGAAEEVASEDWEGQEEEEGVAAGVREGRGEAVSNGEAVKQEKGVRDLLPSDAEAVVH